MYVTKIVFVKENNAGSVYFAAKMAAEKGLVETK